MSSLLSGNFAGAVVETIGTFCLVLVILVAVFSKKGAKDWAPLAVGATLVFIVMVGGPLTVGCFNPARWFGPALVGNSWGGVWPYLVGPIVGSLLAVAVFQFVIEAGGRLTSRRAVTAPKKTRAACAANPSPPPEASPVSAPRRAGAAVAVA